MTPSQRDDARRREVWRTRHAGHDLRRNSRGELRCGTCYRERRGIRVRPDDGIVDEVVIARLLAGQDVIYTVRERDVAAVRMDAAGFARGEIARRLKLSGVTMAAVLGAPEPVETFMVDEAAEDELADATAWAVAA